MATIKLTILRDRPNKDGSHKIRIALGHKSKTAHIATKYSIPSEKNWKDGQIKGLSNSMDINRELRVLLNEYQNKLDRISNQELYECSQLKELLKSGYSKTQKTFQSVNSTYVNNLIEDKRNSYATLIERNGRYFKEFCKGDILLTDITPTLIDNYSRFLKNKKGLSEASVGMQMSRTRTIWVKNNLFHIRHIGCEISLAI